MERVQAGIIGLAHHLPDAVLTNDQLAKDYSDWDPHKIALKTGILSRRVARTDECASDLGVEAVRKLFDSGCCVPSDIDFLLFCTQTPDHFLPTTACIVHDRLGLREDCAAIDVNQGCSGYVYGIALARSLVEGRVANRVMLITSDTYTKFINPGDKSTRTLFGDGASATLVGPVEADAPGALVGPFVFGTDGSGAPNLIVPSGGLRYRPGAETRTGKTDAAGNYRTPENLYMNGPEIFTFTLNVVPRAVQSLLMLSGLQLDDINKFIFHQASRFMLDRLRDKLGISPSNFVIDLENTGNTVSSSIPIALGHARRNGSIRPGDRLMLVGFGVGYSWAATIIRGF